MDSFETRENNFRTLAKLVFGLLSVLGSLASIYAVLPLFLSPSISFRPSAEDVPRGGSVAISWQVMGDPEQVLLDGQYVPPAGERAFKLSAGHTFTLTARKHGWMRDLSSSKSIVIGVTAPPIVAILEANPDIVKPGEQVLLSWDVTNAQRVEIEPIGLLGNVKPHGKRSITISDDTTFRLSAYASEAQTVIQEKTVQVEKTELQISLLPDTVHLGESARLKWQTNATTVHIEPGLGNLQGTSGEIVLTPGQSTTYEVAADGPGGVLSRTVTVTVLPRLKPSVAVLDSVVATGPYVDSLIPEMTQQLRDDLRRRGYDVLVSSLGSRSVEQFVVQFRGLSSEQQHLIGKPDFVAQLTLRVSEERRNLPAPNIVNPFGRFRNGPPQPALAQLTSTCVASINVIRVPEGQYFDRGTSGDIQLSGVVNTQLAGWQAAQKSLTTHTAQKAVAEALSRLQQRQ